MFWSYFKFFLTSPGIIVHELAHAFFCVLFGVKIHEINLLRYNEVAGYVVHDEPRRFLSAFFISFGPLIINSLLAIYLFTKFQSIYNLESLLYFWLAFALGLQAIPSTGDAKALFNNANHNFFRNPLVIIFYPLVLALYLLNLLKYIFIDLIYVVFLFYIAQTYFKGII
ncbi:MAG: M50 family metallopeptidase [Patescibacteria group bacterium]